MPKFVTFLFVACALGQTALGERIDTRAFTLTDSGVEAALGEALPRVEEFRFLEAYGKEHGFRVYLFGGTASSFAHYVKWDLLRRAGDTRFNLYLFDYHFTSVFRPSQDVDIVIDGTSDDAEALEAALKKEFPYLQGAKSAWEVRLLAAARDDKEPLLGNPDFANQNTDSQSTGLIEVTSPAARRVRDVRDWSADTPEKTPRFLADLLAGRISYFVSPLHHETARAKAGKNPELFSAVRLLIKAAQLDLVISREDLQKVQGVVARCNPEKEITPGYVRYWLEKNGAKIFHHTVDLERSFALLQSTGLGPLLVSLGDRNAERSMPWWLSKEPLIRFPLGGGSGKTARVLGLTRVAHATDGIEAYMNIMRSPILIPNVTVSRQGATGEGAVFGNGFYTMTGDHGFGRGPEVLLSVAPEAREGTDFVFATKDRSVMAGEKVVIFLNGNALRLIPRDLGISPREVILRAFSGNVDPEYFTNLEPLKRRFGHDFAKLSEKDKAALVALVIDEARTLATLKGNGPKRDPGARFVIERSPFREKRAAFLLWFELPSSVSYPEIVDLLWKERGSLPWYEQRELTEFLPRILQIPHWRDSAAADTILDKILRRKKDERLIPFEILVENVFSGKEWLDRPGTAEYIDRILAEKGTAETVHMRFAKAILSQERFNGTEQGAKWIEALARGPRPHHLFTDILKRPCWVSHPRFPRWLKLIQKRFSEPDYQGNTGYPFNLVYNMRDASAWATSAPMLAFVEHFWDGIKAVQADEQIRITLQGEPWKGLPVAEQWLSSLPPLSPPAPAVAESAFSPDVTRWLQQNCPGMLAHFGRLVPPSRH